MATSRWLARFVRNLMTTLEQIDKRVAVIETQINHLATKEDVANVKFDLLKWLVPIILGQTAVVFAAARLWG